MTHNHVLMTLLSKTRPPFLIVRYFNFLTHFFQIEETKTKKYARVTSQYFEENGIPYPDEPNAPRYDANMIPFVP